MSYTIYSVEDDSNIARIINISLSKQGYSVRTFADGASFRQALTEEKPDMILLDLMLPDCNGLDLLKSLRSNAINDSIEIIIVSAKSQIMDKVDGLDLGADDYIEKPFDLLELISRVNSKARRHLKNQSITIGKVTINNSSKVCLVDDKEVSFTNTEFTILYSLMANAGIAVSRDDILKTIWGNDESCESRTIDVHIKAIRSKLKEEGNRIISVYGIGYRYIK
ncbi:MAG: response regulator transcription factor [Bacilli bacterium]